MPSSLLLSLALGCLAVSASAHQVNLYHRLYVPSVSSRGHPAILPPWLPRGTAEILDSRFAKYAPVSNLNEHLALYRSAAASQEQEQPWPLSLYQVAVELPGVPPNLWPFSSVKACHLTDKTADSIRIHVGDDPEHTHYAISYWIDNIPADGACPANTPSDSPPRITNTTVSVHSPTTLPSPELKAPPPLTPEGQPVQPVQEQTFFQKYWMHIIGVLLFITFISPAPEEENKEGGGEKK